MKANKQKILESLKGRASAGGYLTASKNDTPILAYMNTYDDELDFLKEPRKTHYSLIGAIEEAIDKIKKGRKLLMTISFDMAQAREIRDLKIVPRNKIDAMIIDYLIKND